MSIINPNNPAASINEQQQMLQFAKVLKSAPDMECEKCKSQNFILIYRIKKVSGLITGTGRDIIAPISVYGCAKCGHINKFFMDKLDETEEAK